MVSLLVLRRVSTPSLLNKFLHPLRSVAVAPSASRSFSTNAQLRHYDDDERGIDVSRCSGEPVSRRRDYVPSFFSDVLDPFFPTRSLSQVLNLMDQFMDNPFLAASRGMGAGSRRGCDVKEDENGLYVRIDMLGLGKDNVKVSVEQNTLIIKGEGEKESEEEESGRRYSSRIDLPEKLYKTDQIKAEMKNDVVKEEERKGVFHVIIKGEGEKESEEEESGRRYSSRTDLPEKLYKTDQIKAEMKNDVVKEEERKGVFHVNIE